MIKQHLISVITEQNKELNLRRKERALKSPEFVTTVIKRSGFSLRILPKFADYIT